MGKGGWEIGEGKGGERKGRLTLQTLSLCLRSNTSSKISQFVRFKIYEYGGEMEG